MEFRRLRSDLAEFHVVREHVAYLESLGDTDTRVHFTGGGSIDVMGDINEVGEKLQGPALA
jgi:hypothetical protein